MANIFLMVGLGNPGKEYQNTWHSLGFLVVDEFAKNNNFPDFRSDKKSNSLISKSLVDGQEILLAKPQTFMNESGKAVKSLINHYQLNKAMTELSRWFIVIHDDADLPKGEIRISENRGTAGHKGIESIVNALKTKNFIRIRLGVRPKNYVPGSKSLARFVLKKFTPDEKKIVAEVMEKTTNAIETILQEGVAEAMARFN